MTHVAYREGASEQLEAEFVVVGSGAGGATAAVTLARGGAKVVLVEAGPWRDPKDYPSSCYGVVRDLFDDWGALLTRGRALWPVVQASAVGGSTVINSAICVRTPEDIFALWRGEHGIEGLQERLWSAQDAFESELSVEEVPESSAGNSNKLAMLGSQRLQIEGHVMACYVKECAGAGQCLQGCRDDRKRSLNVVYAPELLDRGSTVVSCAPVKRILFEGKRAVGVIGRFRHPKTRRKGAHFEIRATKGVVVAASATHSPALLQRSGVRSPALGKFFRSHPGTGVFGVYDDPVDQNIGTTQGWASTEFRNDPGFKIETLSLPLEIVASRLSGAGHTLMERLRDYRHLAMWAQATRAETQGEVTNGWGDKPAVRYTLGRRDMEKFRSGLHQVARLHVAAGARAVLPGIHGMPFELHRDQIGQILDASLDPRSYIGVLSHLFGGCVMGADPTRSVCDGHGRVHGYQHLSVADASAIPTVLGVNPQHTIMALARIWAEDRLEEA